MFDSGDLIEVKSEEDVPLQYFVIDSYLSDEILTHYFSLCLQHCQKSHALRQKLMRFIEKVSL